MCHWWTEFNLQIKFPVRNEHENMQVERRKAKYYLQQPIILLILFLKLEVKTTGYTKVFRSGTKKKNACTEICFPRTYKIMIKTCLACLCIPPKVVSNQEATVYRESIRSPPEGSQSTIPVVWWLFSLSSHCQNTEAFEEVKQGIKQKQILLALYNTKSPPVYWNKPPHPPQKLQDKF